MMMIIIIQKCTDYSDAIGKTLQRHFTLSDWKYVTDIDVLL